MGIWDMLSIGSNRRRERSLDEQLEGLADRVDREGVSADKLQFREGEHGDDVGRVDELREGTKRKLIARAQRLLQLAGHGTENAAVSSPVPSPGAEAAPLAPEKVLSDADTASLFRSLESRFTKNPGEEEADSSNKRYNPGDIAWPIIQQALKDADKRLLYGFFHAEQVGHEFRVVEETRGGKKGLRFDTCSQESPAGVRDVNYFEARAKIKEWFGEKLMETGEADFQHPDVARELKRNFAIDNETWDHLKTGDTDLAAGFSWYVYYGGVRRYDSPRNHSPFGGFRCSLWVPLAF